MQTIEIKKYIHKKVDKLDKPFLNVIYTMLQTYTNETNKVIGYNVNGEVITKNELLREIKLSEKEIEDGKYISQEDLEKESEKW